jgi:putative transposase
MLQIHGMHMVFDRELGDQSLIFTRIPTGIPWLVGESKEARLLNWADVETALASGEFKILGKVESLPIARKPYASVEDAAALDPGARMRACYVRAFDKAPVGLGYKSLRAFIEQIATSEEASEFSRIPSPSSLRRWIQKRGTIGDRRVIDMVSMIGRTCKTHRFAPTVNRAVRAYVIWFWALKSRSFTDSYARLCRMIHICNHIRTAHGHAAVDPPSYEALRRYIRAAGCKDTWIAKYGPRAANIRWGPVGEGLIASTILELTILDHTGFDNVVVMDIEKRPPMERSVLAITVDVFSRCILAWILSFEPPQIWSVATSIRMANRPKPWLAEQFPDAPSGTNIYGKMAELVVDNAWENIGRSVKDGLHDLGISLTYAPIATPEYTAIGERFFKTLNTLLVHKLPGAVDVDVETRRLLHIDPEKNAILALEEVEALIIEAVNLYHHKVHETLNAAPGLVCRKAAANGVQVLNDDSLLTATLGTVEIGNLDRRGVKFNHIWYRDATVIGTILDNNFHKVPLRDRRKKTAQPRAGDHA